MKQKIEDVKIVEELKRNSSIGTELLFDKYYGKLKEHGKKYYDNLSKEDIEELASDSIFDAYQKINTFEFKDQKGFRTWLYKIFKFNILDFFKKKELDVHIFDENSDSNDSEYHILTSINREVDSSIADLFISTGITVDERKKIIYETFDEFKNEEKEDLWVYFNDVPHKDSAFYRNMNDDAYRQRISRLLKSFFNKIGQKTNKDGKQIYEEYKKQNR